MRDFGEAINISHDSFIFITDHLGEENAMRQMGAAFALSWPHILSSDNFEVVFDVIQSQCERDFTPFHKHGRNVDSPRYTGGQVAVTNKVFLRANRLQRMARWNCHPTK